MSFLLIVVAALAAAPAPAPKVVKLASPGLSGVGLQAEYIDYFSEQLGEALAREGLRVITKKEISSLLGFERQKSLIGCAQDSATSSCMAELGNALGVDGLVLGDVAKLGKTYSLTVKIVKSDDGERLMGYSGKAGSEEELLELINTAGRNVAAALRERFGARIGPSSPGGSARVVAPSGPPPPLQAVSWIPAAGGVVLGGAAAAMFIGASGHLSTLQTGSNLGETEARRLASEGRLLEGGAWTATALGVAALGAAAWMFLAPAQKAPLVLPAASGTGVSVLWRWP